LTKQAREHPDWHGQQGIKGLTKQQASLYYKRSNQIKDYMNQAVRYQKSRV